MDWKPADLLKLRQVLQVHDPADIQKVLTKYTEMVELFSTHFSTWPVPSRVDWSIAVAMAPDWFGEILTTRINNSMLVSALLITVTTALLLAPPEYEVNFRNYGKESDNTRVFFYFCSIVNLMFIASIITGVAFVENAMSRAYTEADKMILIAKHYYVLNISQTLAMVGAFLFIFVITIPTYALFKETDAIIMTIITVVFTFFVGYMFVTTNINASALQLLKTKQFVELVDSSNGRLLPQFYPNPDDDATPEYFDSMFVVDKQKAATSLLDYTRT